jgi:hypothetical protein
MSKLFAIVYHRDTKEIYRLIDTSDDPDHSHLYRAKEVLKPHEVMEAFPLEDYPFHPAREMVKHIGKGQIL